MAKEEMLLLCCKFCAHEEAFFESIRICETSMFVHSMEGPLQCTKDATKPQVAQYRMDTRNRRADPMLGKRKGERMKKRNGIKLLYVFVLLGIMLPQRAQAMHIMEGFLTKEWALFWFAVCIPFLVRGMRQMQRLVTQRPEQKLLLALSGAFAFLLSALKIPSVTGSCSHPTGVGFGAILFGPTVMTVIGTIVLLFQAVFLAHGGLTTLGANVFSMAIVGPLVAFGVYRAAQRMGANLHVSVFLAAFLGDLCTYVVTALQLSLVFIDPVGGLAASMVKFLSLFAVTQIPIAVAEGLLTVLIVDRVHQYEGGALFHEEVN